MSFTTESLEVATRDGRECTLLAPVAFTRPLAVGGQTITIPAGATTDGASIPPAAWTILPPFGAYWRAAVLHDAMYRRATVPPIDHRATADLVFFEAMLACGVRVNTARLIYAAVRECGQRAWDASRPSRHLTP